MRIKALFTICFTATTIASAVAGGAIALSGWKNWTAAAEARELLMLFKATAQINEYLALERGSYNELLASSGPVDVIKLAVAKINRAKTDAAGREQTRIFARLDGISMRQVSTTITDNLAHLAELRRTVDEEIAQNGKSSNLNASKRYQQQMIGIVGVGFTLASLLESDIAARDSGLLKLIAVTAYDVELRDIAGAQSAWLTQYTVNRRPFDPLTVKTIDSMDGRINQLTESLDRSILDAGNPPTLVKARAIMRDGYSNHRVGKYAALAKAAAEGSDPGLTAAQWRPWTTLSLSSILAVRDAAMQLAENESAQAIVDARMTFAITCAGIVGAACLCLVCASVLIHRVIAPLERLSYTIRAITAGQMDIPPLNIRYEDEIGDIASAVIDLHDASRAVAEMRKEQIAFQQRVEEERRSVVSETAVSLRHSVGAVINEIRNAAGHLDLEAKQLSAAAAHTAKSSALAVASSYKVSSKIEATHLAAVRLASLVERIREDIQDSSTVVRGVVGEMISATTIVGQLEHAAECIGKITGLIAKVASQTNLLALNATIEAARAGAAGRGFAVVATEVKNLASTTADAAGEITAQIASVQTAAGETLIAIKTILDSVHRVDNAVGAISSAVDGQAHAANEIASNMSDASRETLQAASGIDDVANQSNGVETAASRLSAAVKSLFEQSAQMEADISHCVDRLIAS